MNSATTLKLASYGNYGLHIIKNPAGTFSFVGTIPTVFCKEKETMFGIQYNSPIFQTMQEGIDFFESHKHLVATN